MAQYGATARTNYFAVKDRARFASALPPDLVIAENAAGEVAVFAETSGGAWLNCVYDAERGQYQDFDLVELVASHLADGYVAVFVEVGAEKMRYLIGYAIAVNSRGERRQVDLDDIYPLAAELGSHITHAAW